MQLIERRGAEVQAPWRQQAQQPHNNLREVSELLLDVDGLE